MSDLIEAQIRIEALHGQVRAATNEAEMFRARAESAEARAQAQAVALRQSIVDLLHQHANEEREGRGTSEEFHAVCRAAERVERDVPRLDAGKALLDRLALLERVAEAARFPVDRHGDWGAVFPDERELIDALAALDKTSGEQPQEAEPSGSGFTVPRSAGEARLEWQARAESAEARVRELETELACVKAERDTLIDKIVTRLRALARSRDEMEPAHLYARVIEKEFGI